MQGGDSDPMSFGKEQDNDDSPDSCGKKEAMGRQRSSPLLTSFQLVQLALIGCMNSLGIF